MTDNAMFCPKLRCPGDRSNCPRHALYSMETRRTVSAAWYLVPLFFGIIGGIIAWAVNKDKAPKRARNLLIFGLVWTLIPVIIGLVVFLYSAPHIGPPPPP